MRAIIFPMSILPGKQETRTSSDRLASYSTKPAIPLWQGRKNLLQEGDYGYDH